MRGFAWVDHYNLTRVDRLHLDGKGNLERMGQALEGMLAKPILDDITHQLDSVWAAMGTRPSKLPMNGLRGLLDKRTAHGIVTLMACVIVPLSKHDLKATAALDGEAYRLAQTPVCVMHASTLDSSQTSPR